jgi:hypothetical protein
MNPTPAQIDVLLQAVERYPATCTTPEPLVVSVNETAVLSFTCGDFVLNGTHVVDDFTDGLFDADVAAKIEVSEEDVADGADRSECPC